PDYPKGRQVDPDALDEVQALLGERERRADLLIEHLHLLQDHFGCLYARHLVALADEMKLALAEVYEVASFYAHFDIVMDEETAPPAITVRVCDSLSCALAGGETLLEELRSRLGDGVRVVRAPCMGGCDKAPAVAIAHALHENATADSVAAAVAAGDVYIYLRDEYPQCHEILAREIAAIEPAGLAPHTKIHLRRGAGAYICGEESAMLESIEGRRGLPRHKPPFPSQVGLFGRPTLINNVETLFWVRDIVEKGPQWFTGQGRNGRQGLRTFSVSGRVKEPGVKLAPAGITARQLIDEFCGGMAEGHKFKGYLPGGASGGILPAAKADIPLDFGTL